MGIVISKKYAGRARTEYYMGIVPFCNVVYRIKYILYMGVVVVDSSNKTVPLLSKLITHQHHSLTNTSTHNSTILLTRSPQQE